MKAARIAVLGVAVVAGFLAWRLASNIGSGGDAPVIVREQVETDQVLVAQRDIVPGAILSAADLSWEKWPRDTINAAFVTRSQDPSAIDDVAGAVARTSFFSGEPIRNSKLVKSGAGGFLSATLPAGMRAVATATSPETGAGGFILPNDRVDVIVTRIEEDPLNSNRDTHVSETVLENVRVLAIDQTVEEKDGRMVVVGSVATLELRPEQGEVLTLAQQVGDISLALRSIMDGGPDNAEPLTPGGLTGRRGSVSVVKFGVPIQVNTN
jgi:pilus assembly protein CpaB